MSKRVCVVGNGPSAQGKAAEIDACDFVVRMKSFWAYGATDAGQRIDALAWYGGWGAWAWRSPDRPALDCQHWMTHCPRQLERAGEVGWMRIEHFVREANVGPLRWLSNEEWMGAWEFLGSHPSTGFVAVMMAIAMFPGCKLVLHGFDSTHPDLPNFTDARCDVVDPAHDIFKEKKVFANIHKGWWMGQQTDVTLDWPAMPDLDAAAKYLEEKTQKRE